MSREYCAKCCSEIRLVATSLIQFSERRGRGKNYSANVALACDCTTRSPKATELDSIAFSGEVPEQWEKDAEAPDTIVEDYDE